MKQIWEFLREECVPQVMGYIMLFMALITLMALAFAPFNINGGVVRSSGMIDILFILIPTIGIPFAVGLVMLAIAIARRWNEVIDTFMAMRRKKNPHDTTHTWLRG